MNIIFYETEPHEQAYFSQHLKDHNLTFDSCQLSPARCPKLSNAEVVSIFVCSEITADVLDHFPQLKLLITRSTGHDHIDIEAAKKRDIIVCNAPAYAAVTVAEYTFALMLALSRSICSATGRLQHEHSFSLEHLRGFDLAGKTLGVIGTGRIGKLVAARACAFDMHVLACDLYPDITYANKVGFTYRPYETVVKQADILTFHTELTAASYHMFSTQQLPLLKKGVYVINTARGAIIETEALVQGLQMGVIAGAALDVLEDECQLKEALCHFGKKGPSDFRFSEVTRANEFLLNHPHVLATPHNAFNTYESRERLVAYTVELISSWQKHEPIATL